MDMHRVLSIVTDFDSAAARDRVVLDADERHRRRIVLTGEQGTRLLIDFPKPVSLRDGDGLLLDDGTVVEVKGSAEHLIEIESPNTFETVRLAWHLGNRHTEVQIVGDTIRMRRDNVLDDMLTRLGARLTPLDAAFDPEPASPHAHAHGHDHH